VAAVSIPAVAAVFMAAAVSTLHGTKFPMTRDSLGGAMQVFRAEMVAAVEDQSSKTCRLCNSRLHLVRVVFDSNTGNVVHMFECQCGERIWIE
jgi:hypothetical protein